MNSKNKNNYNSRKQKVSITLRLNETNDEKSTPGVNELSTFTPR